MQIIEHIVENNQQDLILGLTLRRVNKRCYYLFLYIFKSWLVIAREKLGSETDYFYVGDRLLDCIYGTNSYSQIITISTQPRSYGVKLVKNIADYVDTFSLNISQNYFGNNRLRIGDIDGILQKKIIIDRETINKFYKLYNNLGDVFEKVANDRIVDYINYGFTVEITAEIAEMCFLNI